MSHLQQDMLKQTPQDSAVYICMIFIYNNVIEVFRLDFFNLIINLKVLLSYLIFFIYFCQNLFLEVKNPVTRIRLAHCVE